MTKIPGPGSPNPLTFKQGAIDAGAPYQRQEVFLALRHFFKGNDLMKDRLPTGMYGTQIPEAMVALTATAVSSPSLTTTFTPRPKL